jgi:hypothetical protein
MRFNGLHVFTLAIVVATAALSGCNKESTPATATSDPASAATKAAHEANFPEYVPGNGKAFSSAGGSK